MTTDKNDLLANITKQAEELSNKMKELEKLKERLEKEFKPVRQGIVKGNNSRVELISKGIIIRCENETTAMLIYDSLTK